MTKNHRSWVMMNIWCEAQFWTGSITRANDKWRHENTTNIGKFRASDIFGEDSKPTTSGGTSSGGTTGQSYSTGKCWGWLSTQQLIRVLQTAPSEQRNKRAEHRLKMLTKSGYKDKQRIQTTVEPMTNVRIVLTTLSGIVGSAFRSFVTFGYSSGIDYHNSDAPTISVS